MAYYANAKAGVPFHKREEERRWKQHMEKHKKMLKSTKPTISKDHENGKHLHVRLKLKRLQLQQDRLATIEYENRRLLENITRIEGKPRKEFWNDSYIEKKKGSSPRKKDFESESEASSHSSSESENESDENEDATIKLAKEEQKKERKEEKERLYKQKKEQAHARREAALEHYRRVGILDELKADVTLDENKKLEKRLGKMLKGTEKEDQDNEEVQERIQSIKNALESLRKENMLLEKNDKKKKQPSNRADEERIRENVRLNKKLQEIQKGKGRQKETDAEFNGLKRWWVSSPRGREKSEYERERHKLLEEQRLAREQRKFEREKEEKKIMKQKNLAKKMEKEKAPKGYRKKRRKKVEEDEEEEKEDEEKKEEKEPKEKGNELPKIAAKDKPKKKR